MGNEGDDHRVIPDWYFDHLREVVDSGCDPRQAAAILQLVVDFYKLTDYHDGGELVRRSRSIMQAMSRG